MFNSSREVRGQTRSLTHPGRALSPESLAILAKMAKKILPTHSPEPMAIRPASPPPVVPEQAATAAHPVHEIEEVDPVPNQPHELDSSQPPAPVQAPGQASKLKTAGKTAGNLALDLSLTTAGTVAGVQIVGNPLPRSAKSAKSADPATAASTDNSIVPTDATNSNYKPNNKLQDRALVHREEALSRFSRMLDELD
jgi:hypothetical protein